MPRILFDQNVPRPLAKFLKNTAGYEVSTANEMGWSRLVDTVLLDAAERAGFDVFVTCDRNLRYQQNLDRRSIRVVVLRVSRWKIVQTYSLDIAAAIARAMQGSVEEVGP